VIPVLHESLGSIETGLITQRVTSSLNLIGAIALVLCWLAVVSARAKPSGRWGRTRIGLLATSTTLLILLVVLHRVMDQRLDTSGLRGFYPLHRAYLLASTAQWGANVGALLLFASGRVDHPGESSRPAERP
jgi:hypothetical protein